MADSIEDVVRAGECQHQFELSDTDRNGSGAECVHGCGVRLGDVVPE